MKKTIILTGFLGAGKTTYLNHLLRSNPETKYAIIENEFGEQSIDGDLIIRTGLNSDNILEMNNGCLCCSLNDGLYNILSDLHSRKNDFDELIIEATGVADPAGVAQPFLISSAVKKTFELTNTICIIDAEQIEDQLRDTVEARLQIVFSDVILINKTDLVSRPYLDTLQEVLKGINPLAQIYVQENGKYPIISNVNSQSNLGKEVSDHDHEHSGEIRHSHQHTDIVTHSFVFNQQFDINLLYRQLLILITVQGKDIYRFKSIVNGHDNLYKIVIQSVGKRLHMEVLNEWSQGEDARSKFVFIGKNISPLGFERLLKRCVSDSTEVSDQSVLSS
jgi:G3E family GTPase